MSEQHKPECLSNASGQIGDCDCRGAIGAATADQVRRAAGLCTCGMDAEALAEGYIGAAHLPGCPRLHAKLPPRYSFELQFEPGSINIKIGGDQDGRGLFVFNDDVLDYCDTEGPAHYREVPIEKSELIAIRDFLVERFPIMPGQPDQPAQSYPVPARFTRDMALEEAAQVCDRFGVGHPNIANKIRELIQAKACGTCGGIGRDARDEGGRCQDCGGRGLADGEPVGLHPRAELLRRRTEATMAMRKAKFGGHPAGCDGMRSGVCTCPAPRENFDHMPATVQVELSCGKHSVKISPMFIDPLEVDSQGRLTWACPICRPPSGLARDQVEEIK